MRTATSRGPKTGRSVSAKRYARQNAVRPYLLLAPAFVLAIGILAPFFVAIFYSFTDLTLKSPEYAIVGFRNFINTFSRLEFWHSLGVTLRYAFFATAVEMVLGMIIALLLNQESAFSRFLRLVLIFPLMIAPVIGALAWLPLTNPTAGALRLPLDWLGLGDFRWSADPDWALSSLIIIDVWIYTPFVIILVLAGLRSLPKSPYESALIDGGSAWFVYWKLTLPMLSPVLLIALVFRLMTSLQEFAIIFATTKGGPGDRTLSVALAAYDEAFPSGNVSAAIPMLLFLWLIIYLIRFLLIGLWRKVQQAAAGPG
jgi:multiple sugar transport system permease protein